MNRTDAAWIAALGEVVWIVEMAVLVWATLDTDTTVLRWLAGSFVVLCVISKLVRVGQAAKRAAR